jgi:trimeric autotransporter adhesin
MLRKTLMWLPVLLLFAAPLAAQTAPTPEGTVITNTATVSYTDANGNSYTDGTATASITVGFKAGLLVESLERINAMPGDTGSVLFTITDLGNGNAGTGLGNDWFVIAPLVAEGLVITGYTYNGDVYATLADLNVALAADKVEPAGVVEIRVHFDLTDGFTGTASITLEAASGRDENTTDESTTLIDVEDVSVTVTVAVPTVEREPSSAAYTAVFTVENTGDVTATFNLVATATGGASIVSWTHESVTLAADGTQQVTVTYTVTGAGSVVLTATSSTDNTVTASDEQSITIPAQLLSITKAVTDLDGAAITTALPGDEILYVITVENTSTGVTATSVVVVDDLPASLEYVSHDLTPSAWAVVVVGGQLVTATAEESLAPSQVRTLTIRVRVR